MALSFPQIDPVAIHLGPLQIHWYALAYMAGFLLGWAYANYLVKKYPHPNGPDKEAISDFMTWAILGVLLGGRLGYVAFYNAGYYLQNPLEILQIWDGGMSFHGGVIGLVSTIILFSLKRKINMFRLADIASCAAPMGFFFGRIANFINGELYGRVTDAPWGIVFPRGGEDPRHPSQLYEAILEGLVLFILLFILIRSEKVRERPGLVSVVFLIGYASFRFFVEFFREPDSQLGFVFLSFSMGQVLSSAMIVGGLILLFLISRGKTKYDPA